jgi:hypothetical protein
MEKKSSKTNKTKALQKTDIIRSAILNLTEDDKLKRSNKLWNKLIKKLSVLQDNNYTARQLFDYIERHYI